MAQLAVQLYTLRHYHGVTEQLAAVAEAGYGGVETLATHGLAAGELKALLAAHGLAVCSSHVPLQALREDLDFYISFNQALGNFTLVIPYLDALERPRDARGWRHLGERLAELGRRCRAAGTRLLYHNHDFEMARYDGQTALDWLIEGAQGALEVELDLAWIVKGGEDPCDFLARYRGRCPRVHLKDLAPPGENRDEEGWADVGYGTLEWSRLLPAAREAGAEWLIVEHDAPRDPLRTISRSLATLKAFM